MIAFTIVLGVLLLAAMYALARVVLTHEDRIDRLIARHALTLVELDRQHAEERTNANPDLVEHMRVIESLSQRIQAPERARWDPMPTESPLDAPEAVDTILDEDYWISKEALAEKYLDQMRAHGSDD